MTDRERLVSFATEQEIDRCPFWPETRSRWLNKGLSDSERQNDFDDLEFRVNVND